MLRDYITMNNLKYQFDIALFNIANKKFDMKKFSLMNDMRKIQWSIECNEV